MLKNISTFLLLTVFVINPLLIASTNRDINTDSSNLPANTTTLYKNIVLDLDGVLFRTDRSAAASYLGLRNIAYYLRYNWRLPSRSDLFKILRTIPALSTEKSYAGSLLLPAVMVDWQLGLRTNDDLLSSSLEAIKLNTSLNPSEKIFATKTLQLMFTAKDFIATRRTIEDGVSFLKILKSQNKYRLYALSNWDSESFPLLYEKYPEVFSIFDSIMISGDVTMLKPNRNIYELLLTKFQLNPEETLFIDDEAANIQGAEQAGIHALTCNSNYSAMLLHILGLDTFSQMRHIDDL